LNIYFILLVSLPIGILFLSQKISGKYKYTAVFLLCSILIWFLMLMSVEQQYFLELKAGSKQSSDEKNIILGMVIYGGWLGAILYSAVIALLIKFGFYVLALLRTKT
jgi:hypothetical protein